MSNHLIRFFYQRDLYERNGIKHYLTLDLARFPMILLAGITGSGKTFAARYALAKILAQSSPDCRLMLIDNKEFDFVSFRGLPRFYDEETAYVGLQRFYDEFSALKKAEDKAYFARHILYIDEWPTLLVRLGKQQAEEAKSMLFQIMSTGRAYSRVCIIGTQKPMADMFGSSSRDQFGAYIIMGSISKELKGMLASEYDLQNDCGRGQGHLIINGNPVAQRLLVPMYDREVADNRIRSALAD